MQDGFGMAPRLRPGQLCYRRLHSRIIIRLLIKTHTSLFAATRPQLLDSTLQDPYLERKPPKSTGREYFGAAYVKKSAHCGRRYRAKPNDLIRTATIFTSLSIVDALHPFVLPKSKHPSADRFGGGFYQSASHRANSPPSSSLLPLGHAISCPLHPKQAPPRHRTSCLPVLLAFPSTPKKPLPSPYSTYETFHQPPRRILPSATGARGPAILGKFPMPPPR